MLAFSSDIDWAPEEVIHDTLSLFEQYQVKCTLFATHSSTAIKNCEKKLFEVAIHPNFNPLLEGKGGSVDKVLEELIAIYPDSKGVRSHSVTQNSYILNAFKRHGLFYDSNHFLPYHSGIKPFVIWNGLIRIPYNWEDDIHWMYGNSFNTSNINLSDNGLNIFDFHPIHVFLNTENSERYENAKKYYHQPEKLLTLRNQTPIPGTRDLLINLLKQIQSTNIKTYNLLEIAELHIKQLN